MSGDFVSFSEWKGGEKKGRQYLNRYRKVSTPDDTYIEIKFKDNSMIAKCDLDSVYLLHDYSWRVTTKNGEHFYLTSRIQKDGKQTTTSFSRLAMCNSEEVRYNSPDTLDCRKKNLSSKHVNNSIPEVPDIDQEVINSLLPGEEGEWQSHRYGGALYRRKSENRWVVEFQSPPFSKSFSDCTYDNSKILSREASYTFRVEEAIRRGLVYNRYRVITTPEDSYLQVEAMYKKEILYFYCDIDDEDLVKKYRWHIKDRNSAQSRDVETTLKSMVS